MLLRCESLEPPMSQLGLGCAKTPAPAAHVETSRRNCAPWSRIVLRARCSIPCWRIVFSTFRNCMSFHTGWVNRAGSTRSRRGRHVRFPSNNDRPGRVAHGAVVGRVAPSHWGPRSCPTSLTFVSCSIALPAGSGIDVVEIGPVRRISVLLASRLNLALDGPA